MMDFSGVEKNVKKSRILKCLCYNWCYMDPTQNNNPFGSFGAGGSPVNGGAGTVAPGGNAAGGGNAGGGVSPNGGMSSGGIVGGANGAPMAPNGTAQVNSFGANRTGYSRTNPSQGYSRPGGYGAGFGSAGLGAISGEGVTINNRSGGRSRRGAIIALVAFIVIAIIGIGAWVVSSSGTGGGGTASVASVKSAFNRYINYVVYNVDSEEDFDFDEASYAAPYLANIDEGLKEDFLVEADELFADFSGKYYEAGGVVDADEMKAVLQDYWRVKIFSEEELISAYLSSDYETVESAIFESNDFEDGSAHLTLYINAIKDYEYSNLEMIVNADMAGCISDNKIKDNCYTLPDDLSASMAESYNARMVSQEELFNLGYRFFDMIHQQVYDGDYGSDDDEDESADEENEDYNEEEAHEV